MKEVKILHMLPALLSLYGEYGNVAILEKVLKDNGYSVTVQQWNNGELNISDAAFIYIGSGTEENLMEAASRLLPNQEAIKQSIESGKLWLATGNAPALFGKSITWKETTQEALAIVNFETLIDTTKRFLGDVLTYDYLGAPMLGFINTSCTMRDVAPVMTIRLNPKLGNDKQNPGEGYCVHNLYATQLIGPVLTKNPHFLAHIYQTITGTALIIDPDSNLAKAYDVSLSELTKRLNK